MANLFAAVGGVLAVIGIIGMFARINTSRYYFWWRVETVGKVILYIVAMYCIARGVK
jgi:hypothetical protein